MSERSRNRRILGEDQSILGAEALWPGVASLLLGIGLLAVTGAVEIWTPLAVDLWITTTLQKTIDPGSTVATLIQVGGTRPFIPILATFVTIVLLLGYLRHRWMGVLTILGISVVPVTALAKDLIQRPRPSQELVRVLGDPVGWSFPSGSATLQTVCVGLLLVVAWRSLDRWPDRIRRLTLGLAVSIAILAFIWTNVLILYVGRHWFTDILGGWLLGGTWLTALVAGYRVLDGSRT